MTPGIRRTYAVMLRQVYLLRGSLARFLPLFIWIAIDMLLWGFMTRYLNRFTGGLDLVPLLLGAVLLWDLLVRVMQGVTLGFFEDVWSRNFLNVFASPLAVRHYLSGLVLMSLATSLLGLLVMLVLAIGIFGLSFAAYGLAMLPFLLILFLFGIALGIFGCGLVLRLGPASEWFVWPIPALVSPFVGVFYPIATLPGWMQGVSKILPPSYVFEGMRGILAGEGFSAARIGIGLGLAVVFVLLAAAWFSRVFRFAVRTGLLARYSAESTG